MGYIYKIQNIINNKVYIGQTQYTIEKRWKEHCYSAFELNIDYPLYKAMRKYGSDNFIIEIIEEVNNKLLNDKEIYWIGFYHSYAPLGQGYNATRGGEGNSIVNTDLVISMWESGESIATISGILGHDRSTIRKIVQTLPSYNEFEARRRGNNNSWKKTPHDNNDNIDHKFIKSGTPVNQYDLDGNLLNTYYNTREATRQTGVSYKTICAVVNHQQKTAGGFQWKYIDDETPIIKLEKYRKSYPVKQFTLDGDYIATYATVAEASRSTGISSNSIRKICQGKIMQPRKFLWEYDIAKE